MSIPVADKPFVDIPHPPRPSQASGRDSILEIINLYASNQLVAVPSNHTDQRNDTSNIIMAGADAGIKPPNVTTGHSRSNSSEKSRNGPGAPKTVKKSSASVEHYFVRTPLE